MQLMRAITIRKSPEEVYAYWRDFRNLPKFMQHLQDVRVIDNTHSHWATKAPFGGGTVEWDAEIVEDQPNEMIAWQSVDEATVPNGGRVTFKKAPRDQGTEVRVVMVYEVPGGKLGEAVAGLFGEDPKRQVYDDLRSLKQVLETGEVLFSDASIHGKPHPAQPSDKIPEGAGIRDAGSIPNAGNIPDAGNIRTDGGLEGNVRTTTDYQGDRMRPGSSMGTTGVKRDERARSERTEEVEQ